MKATSCTPFRFSRCRSWRGVVACTAAVIALSFSGMAQEGKPAAAETAQAADVKAVPHETAQTAEAKAPAANPTKQQKGTVSDDERKKQIADESAELLNMALALKAEVDKTTKDTLSLNVIKKADEIEKLAKQVKEKMKKSGS